MSEESQEKGMESEQFFTKTGVCGSGVEGRKEVRVLMLRVKRLQCSTLYTVPHPRQLYGASTLIFVGGTGTMRVGHKISLFLLFFPTQL